MLQYIISLFKKNNCRHEWVVTTELEFKCRKCRMSEK